MPAKSIDGVSFAPVLREADAAAPTRSSTRSSAATAASTATAGRSSPTTGPARRSTTPSGSSTTWPATPTSCTTVARRAGDGARTGGGVGGAAWRNTVFPLGAALMVARPPDAGELERPRACCRARPTGALPVEPAGDLLSVRVDIEARSRCGHDEGVLVAHGDQGGGYILWIEDGELHFAYNEYGRVLEVSAGRVQAGEHVLRVSSPGGPASGGTSRSPSTGSRPGDWMACACSSAWRRSRASTWASTAADRSSWPLYERRGSFAFTGDLRAVTYTPGEPAPYDVTVIADVENGAALYFD